MFENYSDMDRLVLERWPDILGLIEAHKATQDQIEAALDTVGDRITRWVREQGFDGVMEARQGEYHVWRPEWYDKRREEAKVLLTIGGFCPAGYRKVNDKYPYLWVNTYTLERFKVKAADRASFGQALRAALGDEVRNWEDEHVDEADGPLGRYLRQYDNAARARLVLESDALFLFCKEHLPTLFGLADVVDAELKRAL